MEQKRTQNGSKNDQNQPVGIESSIVPREWDEAYVQLIVATEMQE